MNVLIVHGIMGRAGIHWQQWLHDELARNGHTVLMPEMPHAEHPDRTEWLETIKTVTADIAVEDLVIIGHSLGVTTALDFVESVSTPVRGLVSVAGFARDWQAELNSYFLAERTIDLAAVRTHVRSAAVFFADTDPYVPQEELWYVARELGVEPL